MTGIYLCAFANGVNSTLNPVSVYPDTNEPIHLTGPRLKAGQHYQLSLEEVSPPIAPAESIAVWRGSITTEPPVGTWKVYGREPNARKVELLFCFASPPTTQEQAEMDAQELRDNGTTEVRVEWEPAK